MEPRNISFKEAAMFEQRWRQEAIIDLVKLALAAFLTMTPWVFGYTAVVVASGNAWISGAVIGLASIAGIVALAQWEEWVSLILGLWVAISPWLLGYQATVISAMRANAAIGIAVVLLAAAELAMIYRSPPQVTA
jgi:SPW repeat-containing protein